MDTITYSRDRRLSAAELASIFARSGINRKTQNVERMASMAATADLLVTAWAGDVCVGVSRSLTDFCAVCYLADLAVDRDYQRAGIGRELVVRTQEVLGPDCVFFLMAAPSAMDYYPKLGFAPIDNGFIIRPPQ